MFFLLQHRIHCIYFNYVHSKMSHVHWRVWWGRGERGEHAQLIKYANFV